MRDGFFWNHPVASRHKPRDPEQGGYVQYGKRKTAYARSASLFAYRMCRDKKDLAFSSGFRKLREKMQVIPVYLDSEGKGEIDSYPTIRPFVTSSSLTAISFPVSTIR